MFTVTARPTYQKIGWHFHVDADSSEWVGRRMVLLVALDGPGQACAGMPTVLLSDLARMRFQTISFFLLVLLGCSWIIQRIWNCAAA